MNPLTRGALFEKTAPLDPPQKLFINFLFVILNIVICNLFVIWDLYFVIFITVSSVANKFSQLINPQK